MLGHLNVKLLFYYYSKKLRSNINDKDRNNCANTNTNIDNNGNSAFQIFV